MDMHLIDKKVLSAKYVFHIITLNKHGESPARNSCGGAAAVGGNAERTNFVTIMRFIGGLCRPCVVVLYAFVQNLTINNIKN